MQDRTKNVKARVKARGKKLKRVTKSKKSIKLSRNISNALYNDIIMKTERDGQIYPLNRLKSNIDILLKEESGDKSADLSCVTSSKLANSFCHDYSISAQKACLRKALDKVKDSKFKHYSNIIVFATCFFLMDPPRENVLLFDQKQRSNWYFREKTLSRPGMGKYTSSFQVSDERRRNTLRVVTNLRGQYDLLGYTFQTPNGTWSRETEAAIKTSPAAKHFLTINCTKSGLEVCVEFFVLFVCTCTVFW